MRWSDLQQLVARCPAPVRQQFEEELPTVLLPDLGRWAGSWFVSAQSGRAPRRYG